MHLPAALHLAGLLQAAQGLKGAAFLPADFAGALAIIIFPYIIKISSWGLAFPRTQRFVDATVGVVGSFFTGQLLFHTGHPGTE
jgi:hypothetical protein